MLLRTWLRASKSSRWLHHYFQGYILLLLEISLQDFQVLMYDLRILHLSPNICIYIWMWSTYLGKLLAVSLLLFVITENKLMFK